MPRNLFVLVLLSFFAGTVSAQDLSNIQIHGFATQAFLYSNDNNYLGMNTSQGSTGWTEAAINIVDQPNDNLRIGIQLHYTRLGIFGGDEPSIDWAMGDYRVKPWLGLRAGKVKIRWGLYNDTQDADPGYLWSLLPESIYSIDDRATTLSQLGGELYGTIPLSKKWGSVVYSLYFGNYYYASNDGFQEGFKEAGIIFGTTPGGKTPGVDLRWKTPFKGLLVGASTQRVDARGTLVNGTFRIPPYYSTTGYAQYDAHKLFFAYQYARTVTHTDVEMTGLPPSLSVEDSHTWFVMAAYHVTDKLQLGTYYSSELDTAAGDNSDPANFGHDWTISSRYDFNSYFYGKLEGHFINGDVAGLYDFDNPNGFKPRTRLVVAKIGFVF
ncbi:MAG: hypothetical protein ABSG69_07665 [Candidatus Acidiferrum sp.]|jgi:hypothetical protein